MRGATLAGAVALIAGVAAAPAPQEDISVINNAKVTNTLTTTYTKTKTVKETALTISTTTKTVYVTDKVVSTYTTQVGSVYTGPTITITASAPTCPAPVTVTRTVGSTTSATPTTMTTTLLAQQVSPSGHASPGLADLAAKVRNGIYFGTAVDAPGTNAGNDPIYLNVAQDVHEFNQWTPANTMKWFATEPQQGVFDFSGAEAFLSLAATNGTRAIRCHNLVWHSQLPTWLTSGNWTRDALIGIMENHIEKLMVHFGDRCLHWDVVNEALADTSSLTANPWRNSMWYRIIGPNWVELAFRKAAAVKAANNLKVGLYYNDYSIEWPGAKTTNAAILAYNLTQAGIAIDGIGAQSHFTIGGSPPVAAFMATLANYTNKVNQVTGKNLDVALTELDIRGTLPVSAAQQIQQFYDYGNATQACALTAGCVGITVWDFDDTYSWIPYTFPGQGWAHIFFLPANGTELIKKIAYDGVRNGLTNGTAL